MIIEKINLSLVLKDNNRGLNLGNDNLDANISNWADVLRIARYGLKKIKIL